jgi:hypothetical protein
MPENPQEDHLARIAGDIAFSDKYMDLLESIYSERETILEFETNPKHFLMRHGIGIPDGIDVVIHHPGALGKAARVDFHWGEWVQTAEADKLAARRKLRELARAAWDTLHGREMKRLRQTIQSSPEALKEFASDPKAYATAHQVTIPDELELLVHLEDPNDPVICLHFDSLRASSSGIVPLGGCCYCRGGGCCYYARF